MHQPTACFGLGSNQIADIGAAAIGDALKYNQQLQRLYLGNDQMMSCILACVIYAYDKMEIRYLILELLL
jgi:hypothetical protein